ncbi:hypothetical protein FHS43_001878 [Streptosporangium becharense]|uniref:Condensation domain-containing protein n=1 Tax=Streptosporangium becharense TaxID=1816182 RepID=A0A7W9IBQ4_9ACTN|nr:condensation domain-containing protein [Streptosporangium becharense]MBB2910615.1 hypothetical protein [Streptosporangium becharense]MBB5817311.1 hypothetical protein [Streptosporangium becharense]
MSGHRPGPNPTVIVEAAPLSPGQERLIDAEFALADGTWPAPGDTTRLRPIDTGAVLVDGPLDAGALQRAVSALVVRQSALRTTFRQLPDATPVQLVAARIPDRVTRSAITAPPGTPPGAGELLRQPPAMDLDPRRGPLFRVHLVELGTDRHVVLLQIHHLVSDGWSIGVLYRELSALYDAAVLDRPAGLPALPRSFADVCRRMRRERGGPEEQRQLRFWRERLTGPWPAMTFTERPAPPAEALTPVDVERVHIPAALVRDLRETARGGLAGPFLAALALVLHHRTAAADIRIGMMIANRARPDVEHLIGYFVNTAVIRLRIDPASTAARLVAEAGVAVTEAIEHQALPIQDLREDLCEHAGLGSDPLYQVTVALNTMRPESLTLTGAHCQDIEAEDLGPRLAPTGIEQRWVLDERAGALVGTLTYKTGTFTETEIKDCLGDLDRVLRAITDPGATVADIMRSAMSGPGEHR